MSSPCGHLLAPSCGCPQVVSARQDAEEQQSRLDAFIEMMSHQDGWHSALTAIGTQADKRESHHFFGHAITYQKTAELWERDDIAAKAIEGPSAEAFREGYEICIADEKHQEFKTKLLRKLRDLDVDKRIERAWQFMRAYGGSAIMMVTNDNRSLDQPLDPDGNWEIEGLNVYEPIELQPAAYYQDPFKINYGQPQFFKMTGARPLGPNAGPPQADPIPSVAPLTFIHASRLLVFQGIRVSNYWYPHSRDISQFWGTGVMPRFYAALRDCDVAYAGAGILATDVSQPVVTIEGLKEMVGKNEGKLMTRMRAFELSRSVARMILLNPNEKFERQTTNLAGIPELLDRLSQRLAAAVGIPLSVLFGYSPASLGSPDNKELELWYNTIRSLQRRELTPKLTTVIDAVIHSMKKRDIPEYAIEWKDLEHRTISQRIEDELNLSRKDTLDLKGGVIYSDEARNRYRGSNEFTVIDQKKAAPDFLAPLPAGVLPKAMSAPAESESRQAGNVPGAVTPAQVGPAAHAVGGYIRRNHGTPATGEGPTVGGNTVREDDGGGGVGGAGGEGGIGGAIEGSIMEAGGASARKVKFPSKKFPQTDADVDSIMAGSKTLPDEEFDAPSEPTLRPQTAQTAPATAQNTVVMFSGLPVHIENPVGSVRNWTDSDGTVGQTKMKHAYGEILGTVARDADPYDVYLGPDEHATHVHVVHQMRKAGGFQQFDEPKLMVGFSDAESAKKAYLAHYDNPKFFGGMHAMPIEELRAQVQYPVAEHKPINVEEVLQRMDHIVKRGGKYVVTDRTGTRTFGSYATKEEAVARLREVEGHAVADVRLHAEK